MSCWFSGKKTHYIVFSEKMKKYAIKKKINNNRISVFNYICNKKYSTKLNDDQIKNVKEKLGFSLDKKLILVLGGGVGIPKGEKILRSVADSTTNTDLVLVAGNDKQLKY